MRKILKHFVLILLIAHCALIFGFSAQNQKQSSVGSNHITQKIVGTEKKENMTMREWVDLRDITEYLVRKAAHLFLYAVLGILAYLSARKYLHKRQLLSALLFCLLYAISDEVHQVFVPGRSGQISDVLVDFVGSLLSVALMCLIFKIKRRKKA